MEFYLGRRALASAGLGLAFAGLAAGCGIEFFGGTGSGSTPPDSGHTSLFLRLESRPSGLNPHTGIWEKRNAYITSVKLVGTPGLSPYNQILFLKRGRKPNDCADPNAVVPLSTGDSMGPSQLEEIFGTRRPTHFATFAGCVGWNDFSRSSEPVPLSIAWKRLPASPRLVASQAPVTAEPRAARSSGPRINGRGECTNSSDGSPVVAGGVFRCELAASADSVSGLGFVSNVVESGTLESSIAWDVFGLLGSIQNSPSTDTFIMTLPETEMGWAVRSLTGQRATGILLAAPIVHMEGTDLCNVTFRDDLFEMNIRRLESPELSSFVTNTAKIALESNATIKRYLVQAFSEGFLTYIPEFLPCASAL